MKRAIFVVILVCILATGTAFADHPAGFGIGVQGGFGWGTAEGGYGTLTLKIPNIPIFWAVNLGFGAHHFGIGVSGDYYIIDQFIAHPLHWFFGVGGFFNFYAVSDSRYYNYSRSDVTFGLRVPVGLSLQPIPLLELYIAIVPGIGVYIQGEERYEVGGSRITDTTHAGAGLGWILPFEIGLRLWF